MTDKTQKSKEIREGWVQMDTLCCGTGWDEADLKNPQILVEDVFGSSHPGSIHLDTLAAEVSTGIYQNGGKPANFHGTDICDGWAMSHDGMNFILPSREVLCDLVEVHGRVIPWDGLVVISSCDKSVPAHLMAAARLNIPAIHIPGGSNRAGPDMSHSLLVGELATRMRQGEDVVPEIRNYKLSGCPGAGACQFMGTASTMQCMAEALGMALPGSALAPVSLFEIRRLARQAGRQIMQLSQKGLKPSDILTRAAFENLVNLAIDQRVSFVLLSGDLYDGDWKDYDRIFVNRPLLEEQSIRREEDGADLPDAQTLEQPFRLVLALRHPVETAVEAVKRGDSFGGFDLSVGSVMCLAMVIGGKLFLLGVNPWLASLIGIAVCSLIGFTMGIFVTKVGLNFFITTLAFMGIARGLCFVITQGTPLSLSASKAIVGVSGASVSTMMVRKRFSYQSEPTKLF